MSVDLQKIRDVLPETAERLAQMMLEEGFRRHRGGGSLMSVKVSVILSKDQIIRLQNLLDDREAVNTAEDAELDAIFEHLEEGRQAALDVEDELKKTEVSSAEIH